jgi:hypothetical protein
MPRRHGAHGYFRAILWRRKEPVSSDKIRNFCSAQSHRREKYVFDGANLENLRKVSQLCSGNYSKGIIGSSR